MLFSPLPGVTFLTFPEIQAGRARTDVGIWGRRGWEVCDEMGTVDRWRLIGGGWGWMGKSHIKRPLTPPAALNTGQAFVLRPHETP